MLIDMWRTTKRENSTATPVSQPGMFSQHIQKEVKLKEDTSVLNPTFKLKMTGHDGQNYLWAFGRYYWVTNIVSLANEYWEIQCKIDPLGSYRGHIRNTEAFVLYDSTANTEIPDRRLGIATTASYAHTNAEMPWDFGTTSRFIAITGDAKNEAGADATGVYKVTADGIADLGYEFDEDWDELVDDAKESSGVTDAYSELQQIISNISSSSSIEEMFLCFLDFIMAGVEYIFAWVLFPIFLLITWIHAEFTGGHALENIKSAWWLPFGDISGSDPVTELALGGWVEEVTGGAIKINNPIKTQIVPISIPWQFSDWRNVACTEVQLYIPAIGNITIPASAVKGHNQLNLWFCLNVFSGQLSCRIQVGGEITVGCYGANVASPILIGNSNVNMNAVTNTIAGIGTMAAGIATGGTGFAIGGAIAAAASGFESLIPVNTSVGGIGGGTSAGLGTMIWCSVITHNTSDNPANLLNIIGTPTNRLKTLTGSGFCQCMQAHMNMNAVVNESYPTSDEVDQVNAALDSGVFLE